MSDEQMEVEKYAFIDIANWNERQGEGRGTLWLKDYTDKEDDYYYIKLTALQRYVYDALCRIRARTTQRIHNDATYIGRAAQMLAKDRSHVAQAIRRLHADGFLTMWNEQLSLQNRIEQNTEDIEKKKREDLSIDVSNDVTSSCLLQALDKQQISESVEQSDAEAFAEIWMKLMPLNKHWNQKAPAGWKKLLTGDFTQLLSRWEPAKLRELMAYTQFFEGQAQYNYTTKNLQKNGSRVEQAMCKIQKNETIWNQVMSRYNLAIGTPDQKAFNMEDDDEDDLS